VSTLLERNKTRSRRDANRLLRDLGADPPCHAIQCDQASQDCEAMSWLDDSPRRERDGSNGRATSSTSYQSWTCTARPATTKTYGSQKCNRSMTSLGASSRGTFG
ncbi:unnamed protein product, partial [Discosporangium mesarthrocarpum]